MSTQLDLPPAPNDEKQQNTITQDPPLEKKFTTSLPQKGFVAKLKRHSIVLFAITLVAVDVCMIVLAFYLAYLMRLQSEYENISPSFFTYGGMMLIQIISLITTFFFYRLYHRHRTLSHIDEFYLVFGASSVGTIMSIALISFIYKNLLDYPRLMIVYAWLLTIICVSIGRIIHARLEWALRAKGWGRIRLLIIGTGDVARVILQKIQQSPGIGYKIVGFVNNNGANEVDEISGYPVLGNSQYLSQIIEAKRVDEVIIGIPESSHFELLEIIANCERERVAIKVFPDVFQIMATEVSIDDLNGLPLLSIRDVALRGWKLSIKRGMDVVIATALLILSSPLMLFVSLLVKLDSPGAVFYIQERMGLDGKSFPMIKFRSMRTDAEKSGAGWTTKDDSRRTRLGTFIRTFSIDEMPQFINVILGHMSMVGPRPERPVFVNQFRKSIPRYMERHREKAGITGWAQVNGLRGDTSVFERTKYDLWYIENWSILLDIKIMLRTAIKIFFDRSAY